MGKINGNILVVVLSVALLIILTTIICLLNENIPPPKIKKLEKTFPGKRLIYDWQSIEDGRMVYLACDEDSYRACKIIQERHPYTNTTRSCDITLAVEGTVHHPRILVVPFGENRAILLWEDSNEEGSNVRIRVIHLNDCRQTVDFAFEDSRSTSDRKSDPIMRQLSDAKRIVTYDDTFDIFFKDPKRCGDKDCKWTINGEGLREMVKFVNNGDYDIHRIHSIDIRSSSKGYVYTQYNSEKKRNGLFFTPSSGLVNQLTSSKTPLEASIVGETIGVCSKPTLDHPSTNCSQYDARGELKMQFSYQSSVPAYTNITGIYTSLGNIYTLPENGFLLQYFKFVECKNHTDCGSPTTLGYYIIKVDATGKEVGKFYFKEYDDHFGKNEITHIWKNRDTDSYCRSFLSHHGGFDAFNLTTTCFTDAIFSA